MISEKIDVTYKRKIKRTAALIRWRPKFPEVIMFNTLINKEYDKSIYFLPSEKLRSIFPSLMQNMFSCSRRKIISFFYDFSQWNDSNGGQKSHSAIPYVHEQMRVNIRIRLISFKAQKWAFLICYEPGYSWNEIINVVGRCPKKKKTSRILLDAFYVIECRSIKQKKMEYFQSFGPDAEIWMMCVKGRIFQKNENHSNGTNFS